MELIKNNIKLRAIELEDAEILKDMMNDPDIEGMVHGWSPPVSLIKQEEWIKKLNTNEFRFMIEFENETVGTCSISNVDSKNSVGTLNIKLINSTRVRGKGIGTDAISLLVDYCFNELNLNCISASILEYNEGSLNLFLKCGFKKEGTLRSRIYKQGKYHNTIQLSLLREECI